MTAVVEFDGLRVEFAGTAEFVSDSVRGVVCGSVPLVQYLGRAFERGRRGVLLESSSDTFVSVEFGEGVSSSGRRGPCAQGRVDGCDGGERPDAVRSVAGAAGGSVVGQTELPAVALGEGNGVKTHHTVVGAEPGDSVVDLGSSEKQSKTEQNKKKKEKRKRAKLRKRAALEEVKPVVVVEDANVPEWRRQNPRAPFHRSAFADCSDDVRRELRESRAKMLVEKNRVAVVEAECNRRRLQAKLNCQVIEREVETARLKAEAESKRLIEEKMAKMPAGFAETVVSAGLESVFSVPQSLNSSSVSPDSSVSVDFVVKMERTVERLAGKVNDLQFKLDAATAAKPVPVQSVEEKRLAVKATIDRLMASVDEEEVTEKNKKQAFVASMNARAKTTRGEVEKPVREPVSWLPTTKEEIAAHVAMLEREGRMNF